jgi:AP-4 complex subunit beta-1
MVENNRYIDKLYSMLQDVDANVVTNALYVIHEMKLPEGGFECTQTTVMTLLNRIGEFTEWGLNTILEIVSRYKPLNDDETYAIMNLLDPVLRTANSGSVLAALKCFFHLTQSMPEMHAQIVQRSKPPILTLITGAHAEIQYMTLKHLQSILHQAFAQGIFDDEYRQFFVRYNEPPHVKHLKVDLLPFIASSTNARDIASELNEYVTDVDSELSRRAILALGEITARIPSVAEEMVSTILNLMDMESSYVRNQAAIVLSVVIRVHPQLSNLILPHLAKHLRKVDNSEAKAALMWLLGEFGKNILEAPYLLEQYIENYDEEESVAVKTQILTATLKLFFQRPPEVQHMLGKLFKKALNDSSDQDLHDRALLYYRSLANNVEAAKLLFISGAPMNSILLDTTGIIDFAENKDFEHKKRVFLEFNTLAVVFDSPSDQFVEASYQYVSDDGPFYFHFLIYIFLLFFFVG